MRLLVWNIRQGGVRRCQRIAQCVEAHAPDIVALIEFTTTGIETVGRAIADLGFRAQLSAKPAGRNHYLCVFSKTPVKRRRSGVAVLDDSGRWLEVRVPKHRFTFGLAHALADDKVFIGALGEIAARRAEEPFLLVGDFNTGVGPADGPFKNRAVTSGFLAIQTLGFTDIWRLFHGDKIEYTYVYRGVKPYRIDHALASAVLLPRIGNCRYSHEEREGGTSDHSVLLVDIEG